MKNLFTNKTFYKMIQGIGPDETWERVANSYYDKVHNKKRPKPKGKSKYVGIEIECFSSLDDTEILALMLACDLEKNMNISDDGSICAPSSKTTYELRILSKETQLPQLFKKLTKFFKQGKFEVNNSCGLHVHLDMRNRDVNTCYQKLIKFQDVMYGMVSSKRWSNDYCRWSNPAYTLNQRFSAVNRVAYSRHKTIEIRLHHGTMDLKQIHNWVKLLLKAVDTPHIPEFKSNQDVFKWANKFKSIKSYVQNGFNVDWFTKKARIVRKWAPSPAVNPQEYLNSLDSNWTSAAIARGYR